MYLKSKQASKMQHFGEVLTDMVIKIAPLSKRSLPPTPLVGAVCEIIKFDD